MAAVKRSDAIIKERFWRSVSERSNKFFEQFREEDKMRERNWARAFLLDDGSWKIYPHRPPTPEEQEKISLLLYVEPGIPCEGIGMRSAFDNGSVYIDIEREEEWRL